MRREVSRDSEGWESEIEERNVLMVLINLSIISVVWVWSFCGASFRRRESVVERHWFMASSGPIPLN